MAFFTRKKKQAQDTTVEANELLSHEIDRSDSEDTVKPELSIHPEWKIPTEQMYVYRFLNNQCPPLKANQLSLSGIEWNWNERGQLVVTGFIRNTINKPIAFPNLVILLLSENDELLARQEFDMRPLGEVPAVSSRPWNFAFNRENVNTMELPKENWKLAFELKRKHQLELDESWEKALPEENLAQLRDAFEKMDPPKPGEINFMGLQAQFTQDEDLAISVLIRNGTQKNIKLEKLPLVVEDSAGDVVAEGGFKLENLEISANTSKPWTFVFPQAIIQKPDADLTRWKCYPKQAKESQD
ncbi:accessory Sec system S-layer assembly protein [Mangrovibacillus cuniculi]|uniref:Accessory Sec system S-layer assembly protein n=1 Tax=Mangrovibacillus cuniculi TaxID=2593652 RepID=A0A7S8CD14_9BACI|nr:accessory Sec system S-layer assembly protein [Mangrovibacillus cuniculi]QPC47533.1 accessory Sec system S-layer assembly protein [Mangrovibacillus cuniculi]